VRHCEGIAESLHYSLSKEFLGAGKRRLDGDTERLASTPEVKELRREVPDLKELMADLTLESRLLALPEFSAETAGLFPPY
jgi:transposase